MITTRFLSVGRRHGKGLLRDPRRLCQGRDPVPPLGNLGSKLQSNRLLTGLLTKGRLGGVLRRQKSAGVSQLVMSATVRGKRSARCVGVPDGITA